MDSDDLAEDATIGLLRETAGVDEERVAAAVREILAAIGEDPSHMAVRRLFEKRGRDGV